MPPSNSSSSLTDDLGQARDAGDAVAHLDDLAHLQGLDCRVVALHGLAEGGGDVVGVDRQVGHADGLLERLGVCVTGESV